MSFAGLLLKTANSHMLVKREEALNQAFAKIFVAKSITTLASGIAAHVWKTTHHVHFN